MKALPLHGGASGVAIAELTADALL